MTRDLTSKEVVRFIEYLENRARSLDWICRNKDNRKEKVLIYDRIQAVKKEIKVLKGMI